MKIRLSRSTILYYGIFGTVLLTNFFPNYFLQSEILKSARAGLNIIAFVGSILYAVVFRKYNLSIFFVVGYIVIQIMSTFLNGGDSLSAVYGSGALWLTLCITVQFAYEKNEKLFLKTVYGLFYILILVNYITILVFPKGLYYDRHELDGVCFLLGNYNGFIIYIMFALITGYIYEIQYKRKLTWKFVLFCVLTIATYLQVKSVTSIVGVCCIMMYLLVSRFGWFDRILNLKTYVLANIIFFFFIVWNGSSSALILLFLTFVGKTVTFSGRTMIWQRTRNNLEKHWLLGLGLKSDNDMLQEVGGLSAHNLYLDTIYQTGLVGFGLLVGFFVYISSCMRKLDSQDLKDFLSVCIGVFMLMAQFEAYSMRFILFMFTFISMYSKKHSTSIADK